MLSIQNKIVNIEMSHWVKYSQYNFNDGVNAAQHPQQNFIMN